VRLTDSQRRGLESLYRQAPPHIGRESNITDAQIGYVYWQAVRALIEKGLVYAPCPPTIGLTAAGVELAKEIFG